MYCLNCNKKTNGTEVFCEDCLKAMEDYPVDKGTPIVIPAQPSPATPKKQATRLLGSVEEQLELSQRSNRRLAIALIGMALLLAVAAAAVVYLTVSGGKPPF